MVVGAADDRRPDNRGAHGDGDIFADTEYPEPGGTRAELFTDEVGEALARHSTHGHFLDDDKGESGRDEYPKQAVAVLASRTN